MAGRPYYGYGHPPHGYPPGPPGYGGGYPPGPPGSGGGYPPHMYPPGGIMFYPVHPAYVYPYPVQPPPGDEVLVADNTTPTLPGETVELPWSIYRWVPACLMQQSIPPGAVRVGADPDGDEIFAARCHHEGEILPATVIPNKKVCYIAYGGEQVTKDQFEVLVPSMFSWQFASEGEVPPGAVEAGTTADGEKLYFGRVTHDGCQTPGKIHPSAGTCIYPFEGEEKSSSEYEALVLI
ncbi:unnamed protein product [Arctia plantaginis]|uniref:Uncharacterized protein n=1 Tax=Arctia plantaginis TaxID=874455 RepID=A0A8S0YVD5_ARCPL|nr:unnamed protein product [Arctia plantaginis]CAB3236028.1 unnamed protein product [Arctia plantaginis]